MSASERERLRADEHARDVDRVRGGLERGVTDSKLLDGRAFNRRYWHGTIGALNRLAAALDAAEKERDDEREWKYGLAEARDAAEARAEALAAENERLREALKTADLEASCVHDAIWHESVKGIAGEGIGILHDAERNDSANSAIWRLHEVARAALSREPA